MRPPTAAEVVAGLKEARLDFVAYLPDSLLFDVYRLVAEDPAFEAVLVNNEAEGVAVCAGAWLGGRRPVMIMENSGLRMATEVLARIGLTHGIPVLLLMSYRGEFGDQNWWARPHAITMEPVLHALRIPYVVVRERDRIKRAIVKAQLTREASNYHTAVVLSQEVLT